jgi:UDP-N-acetylglucosamine 4,6-dehydratase
MKHEPVASKQPANARGVLPPLPGRFRTSVDPATIDGKSILITGGTGSFGQALAKTLLGRYRPGRLVIFSRDELKQFEMQNQPWQKSHAEVRYFIGDVRDSDRLMMAFRGVDLVIHAAAMKQIPAAEYNPFECIRTNVYGAENVVKAAINAGVKRVVALSTDKAANPINLYGASKLAADKIFVAAKWLVGNRPEPIFSVVRYGNVLGSRGSIVPFFRDLIARGEKTLPITDPRMTRFWITLDDGVDFVLSCLSTMQGGEIFVPKIPSMRVVDLAECLAPGMPTRVVGTRAGEKLHESMITQDDARSTLELPDRFVVCPAIYGGRRHYHADERVVGDEFGYSSDRNDEWLSDDGMKRLLDDLSVRDKQ